jgi:hypothetical protein
MLRVFLGLVVGIALGAGFAMYLDARSNGSHPAAPIVVEKPERAADVATSAAAPSGAPSDERSERAPAADSLVRADDPAVLISSALMEYARANMKLGWSKQRKDEMPSDALAEGSALFEQGVRGMPMMIGRELADRRTKQERALEDARTGGAFALLAKLREGNTGPVTKLAADRDAMLALLQRDSSEKVVDGTGRHGHWKDVLEDGVTLSFPAGVFSTDNPFRDAKSPPRDVTIRGAGMDATLLVMQSDIDGRGELRRFALRDCTVFTNGNYLFGQRAGATVLMERVRVIGFDMGAGSSCALAFDGVVMVATDCRFEGGYGRAPEWGTLFDVRSESLVARFERCTLSLIHMNVQWLRSGATAFFAGCNLIDMLDDPRKDPASHPGLSFADTSITLFGTTSTVPKLDLNTLFPDWQQRMER